MEKATSTSTFEMIKEEQNREPEERLAEFWRECEVIVQLDRELEAKIAAEIAAEIQKMMEEENRRRHEVKMEEEKRRGHGVEVDPLVEELNSLEDLFEGLDREDESLAEVLNREEEHTVAEMKNEEEFYAELRREMALFHEMMRKNEEENRRIVRMFLGYPSNVTKSNHSSLPWCRGGYHLWAPGSGSSTRKEAQARQGKAVDTTSQTSDTNYKEDQHKKTDVGERFAKARNLFITLSGSVSRSSEDLQMGRVDIHAGDENLLSDSFQQEHGIRDVITMVKILVPDDAADDPDAKLLVRMRPYGEGKDSWEHCTTPEGEVALPEEQPLYISPLLRGRSSLPASATWVLETPEKCTPSSLLEAVLEIKLVTSGSMVQAMENNNTDGNPLVKLSVQVKGKEHNASTDVQLSRLAVKPENEQHDNTAEEKYQTEPMEK